MKRIIKFRAWNIPTKQMFYWGTLQEINLTDKRNIEAEHNHFMQFTGLTDKNGKEIYEGDVINDTENIKHIVVFRLLNLAFEGQEITDNPFAENIFIKSSCEVIGNIYENPELLNQ